MKVSGSDAAARSIAVSLTRRTRRAGARPLELAARARDRRVIEGALIRSCLSGADHAPICAARRVDDEEHLAIDGAKGADARLAIVAPLVRRFERRAFEHPHGAREIDAVFRQVHAPICARPIQRTSSQSTRCSYRCQYNCSAFAGKSAPALSWSSRPGKARAPAPAAPPRAAFRKRTGLGEGLRALQWQHASFDCASLRSG